MLTILFVLTVTSLIGFFNVAKDADSTPKTATFKRKGKQIFVTDSDLAMLRKSAKKHALVFKFSKQKNGLLVIRGANNMFVPVIPTLDKINALNSK